MSVFKYRVPAILTALILLLALSSHAVDLQPFGEFAWGDNLQTVMNRLCKMDGIDKINLWFSGSEVLPLDCGQTKPLDLSSKIRGVITNQDLLWYSSVWTYDGKFASNCKEIVLTNGNKFHYPDTLGIEIRASPIMVKEVPFEMSLRFDCSRGLAFFKPDEALFCEDLGLIFPLVLKEIVLVSKSPSLIQKKSEIDGILQKKYANIDTNFTATLPSGKEATVYDRKGRSVSVISRPYHYAIFYKSTYELEQWELKYLEHLSTVEKNKLQAKPDASNKL